VSRFLTAHQRAILGYYCHSIHAGKHRTENKLKIQTIQKLNTTHKKQTTQNTAKQYYPGLASYDTRPGNEAAYSTTLHTGPLRVINR